MLCRFRTALSRPQCRIANSLSQYRTALSHGRLFSSGDANEPDISQSIKMEMITVPLPLSVGPTTLGKKTLSIALVGRPNTGKSTLFNRLTQTDLAIVSDVPGTTRDRKQELGSLAALPLLVMDTGGLDDRGAINVEVQQQVHHALTHADVILFMLDAKVGVTALDEHFAKWIRKTLGKIEKIEAEKRANPSYKVRMGLEHPTLPKELILIANKTEGTHLSDRMLNCVSDALRLGLGDPILMSAAHG